MGSGHFLVSLVDELADRVLEQLAHAEAEAIAAGIAHYRSPVSREIEHLRERILARAQDARWSVDPALLDDRHRSEEHTSELQSLMRITYAVFCLKKKTK